MSLEGNPDNDEQATTLADWALGQDRFAKQFEALASDAPAPIPLRDWLLLDEKGRKGKTAYVSTGDSDDETRYRVGPALAVAAHACLANWQTLQEIAGNVTPFTERVREEAASAVEAERVRREVDAQAAALPLTSITAWELLFEHLDLEPELKIEMFDLLSALAAVLDRVVTGVPEQVLVDPDSEIVRRDARSGLRWTRWGGVQ